MRLEFKNKSFHYSLTEFLKIKKGAKSEIVSIPSKIKESPNQVKRYFLAGLFDSDGGFRGETLGFTTASKSLNKDTSSLLKEFSIKHNLDTWLNKKHNKRFYGIKLKKSEIGKFLNTFPLQNKEKLVRICQRFNAGMPEWPNGPDYSNQLE